MGGEEDKAVGVKEEKLDELLKVFMDLDLRVAACYG